MEKLLEHSLSEKAKHLRVIIAEMGRIASHLVGMGAYGLDLGTFSPFLYAFREREKILDLFEEACGARLTYSYITPGGCTADLPDGWLQKCEQFLAELEPIIAEYHALLTTNAIFIKRTVALACCPRRWPIDYGCTGPVLRGSGVDYDLRRDGEARYTDMYDGYAFEVIVQQDGHYPRDHDYPAVPSDAVLGDCWHRFYVRHAGSHAVDRPRPPGDGTLRRRRRATGACRSSWRRSCRRAKRTWRPRRRGARWVS